MYNKNVYFGAELHTHPIKKHIKTKILSNGGSRSRFSVREQSQVPTAEAQSHWI